MSHLRLLEYEKENCLTKGECTTYNKIIFNENTRLDNSLVRSNNYTFSLILPFLILNLFLVSGAFIKSVKKLW